MKKNLSFLLLILLGLMFSCSSEQNLMDDVTPQTDSKMHFYGVRRSDGPSTKAVGQRDNLWYNGTEIKVKFLNDPYNVAEQIKQFAREWEQYANISFKFVTEGDAHVRIGFDWNDQRYITWSYIGSDCKKVTNQNEATMSFAYWNWLTPEEKKGDVLRAFGHVLGLEFEHRHLNFDNDWSTRVATYWQGEVSDIPWDELRKYVFDPLESSNVLQTEEYDEASIMIWPFPRGMGTGTARFANYELSAQDKEFIATLYPKEEVEESPIIVIMTGTDVTGGEFKIESSSNISIDWGNGVKVGYAPTATITPVHLGENVERTIKIYGDSASIKKISIYRHSETGEEGGITDIDISKCVNLEVFFIGGHPITNLDLSKNVNLKLLDCSETHITDLDVSKNTKLERLVSLNNFKISHFAIKNNSLKQLSLSGSSLHYVNVYMCPNLEEFYCLFSPTLYTIMVDKCSSLRYMRSESNMFLSYIELTGCDSLETLLVSNNNLDYLDVTGCHRLEYIDISNNPLTDPRVMEYFINQLPYRDFEGEFARLYTGKYSNNYSQLLNMSLAEKGWRITSEPEFGSV